MVRKCASALRGRKVVGPVICYGKRKEGEVHMAANTISERLFLSCADNSSF